MARVLKDQYVAVVSDGWSDVHQKPIISNVIVSGGNVFLCDFELATGKKDAAYCALKIKDAIIKAEEKYGSNVVGFISDNEPKMRKVRELLHEWRPSLITVGCGAHYLNLCEKKASPKIIKESVMSIQKFFKNHHGPHIKLTEELGGKKPQVANETRQVRLNISV